MIQRIPISIILILCLTLGLAPFFPEPHIWADLRWILGGAKGMKLINWFDTAMHGFPWMLLLIWMGSKLKERISQRTDGEPKE